MELKPGYKQTEVGVIPGDWSTPELGQILKSMQLGGNYKNSEIPTRWPLIKMGNLGRGTIKLDRLDFVDSKQSPAVRDRLCDGDVLFNTRNTLELVGKVAIWKEELPEAYFNSNIMRMDFDEQRVSSSAFMNFILNTAKSITSLRGIATGTTSVAAIYGRDLAKIVIPLPTKAEQVEIAEALSDADALIESLDQLIAKKRQIKQGAMQELLTGKRRLPGFSGNWEVRRLGDICEIDMGRTPPRLNSSFWGVGHKWLSIADLKSKVVTESKEEITPLAAEEMQVVRKGTLLMSFKLSIGRLCFAGCDLYTNEAICSFNQLKANSDFLYYVLGRIDFSLYGKQAVKGYTLNKESLKLVEVPLPSIQEQTAIASVLSDMDTELAALESRLAKARLIKQGMMQELLTGRIRLL